MRTSIAGGWIDPVGQITISIGIASWQPTHGSQEQILKQADDALYQAKNAGRNCVVIAGQEALASTVSRY